MVAAWPRRGKIREMSRETQLWIFVDLKTSGPVIGAHSMIELGAAVGSGSAGAEPQQPQFGPLPVPFDLGAGFLPGVFPENAPPRSKTHRGCSVPLVFRTHISLAWCRKGAATPIQLSRASRLRHTHFACCVIPAVHAGAAGTKVRKSLFPQMSANGRSYRWSA